MVFTHFGSQPESTIVFYATNIYKPVYTNVNVVDFIVLPRVHIYSTCDITETTYSSAAAACCFM